MSDRKKLWSFHLNKLKSSSSRDAFCQVLLGLKYTPQVEAYVSILSKSDVKDMAATFGSLSTTTNKEVTSLNKLVLFTKL